MPNQNLLKFNNSLQKLINDLRNNYSEQLSEAFMTYYDGLENETESDALLLDYLEQVETHVHLLRDEKLELLEKPLLDHIYFHKLSLDAKSVYDIFRYLKVLYIYAFRYTYTGNVNDLLKARMTNSDKENNTTMTSKETMFLDIVDSLKQNRQNVIDEQLEARANGTSTKKRNEDGDGDGDEDGEMDLSTENIKAQLGKTIPGAGKILDTGIGKLAMNVVQNIDMTKIDLGNPMELMKSLASGNLHENTGLMSLFGSVTTQIETQIQQGNLNTDNLRQEAQQMLNQEDSSLNQMKDMLGGMGGMGGMMNNMMNMAQKAQNTQNTQNTQEPLSENFTQMQQEFNSGLMEALETGLLPDGTSIEEAMTDTLPPLEVQPPAQPTVKHVTGESTPAPPEMQQDKSVKEKIELLEKMKRLKELRNKIGQNKDNKDTKDKDTK